MVFYVDEIIQVLSEQFKGSGKPLLYLLLGLTTDSGNLSEVSAFSSFLPHLFQKILLIYCQSYALVIWSCLELVKFEQEIIGLLLHRIKVVSRLCANILETTHADCSRYRNLVVWKHHLTPRQSFSEQKPFMKWILISKLYSNLGEDWFYRNTWNTFTISASEAYKFWNSSCSIRDVCQCITGITLWFCCWCVTLWLWQRWFGLS